MNSSSLVTLRCGVDPATRLRRRDRRGGTGVDSIEPSANLGRPRRFSIGVHLAVEAPNQLASEYGPLFLRESESFYQELRRIHARTVTRFRKATTAVRQPVALTIQRLLFCSEQVYSCIMLDWITCPAVERQSDKVSGAWIFKGTRVPVRALFENLEEGVTLDDFLKWFPGVTREQAVAVLAHAEQSLTPA